MYSAKIFRFVRVGGLELHTHTQTYILLATVNQASSHKCSHLHGMSLTKADYYTSSRLWMWSDFHIAQKANEQPEMGFLLFFLIFKFSLSQSLRLKSCGYTTCTQTKIHIRTLCHNCFNIHFTNWNGKWIIAFSELLTLSFSLSRSFSILSPPLFSIFSRFSSSRFYNDYY